MKTILAALAALAAVTGTASAGYSSHHSHGHYGYVRVVPTYSYTYVAPVTCKYVWHHGYQQKVCFKSH